MRAEDLFFCITPEVEATVKRLVVMGMAISTGLVTPREASYDSSIRIPHTSQQNAENKR